MFLRCFLTFAKFQHHVSYKKKHVCCRRHSQFFVFFSIRSSSAYILTTIHDLLLCTYTLYFVYITTFCISLQTRLHSGLHYLISRHLHVEFPSQAVLKNMEMPCKCHGMSGSCTTKYCHKSLPQFEGVGHFLRKKYQSAVLVTLDQSSNKLVNYDRIISKYGPQDLLYLEQSPNYCYKDVALGTAGTAGRECNKSSLSENSCDILCCGHGYNTKKVFHFAFIVCSSIAGWENSAWIM